MSDITQIRSELHALKSKAKEGQVLRLPTSFFRDFKFVARGLIEEYGFQIHEEPCDIGDSQEPYWSFSKYKRQERWDYALKDIEINPEWRCIDVGCGRNPWPRANVITDVYKEMGDHKLPHQLFNDCNILNMPYRDKEFDFSTCFHVLEHISDPIGAARELSRIAQRGIVETPTPWKDGMLGFAEVDHRWIVLPGNQDVHLFFYPINLDLFNRLSDDAEARGAIWRTYIANSDNIGDRAVIRNYFERVEPLLNNITYWEGNLRVEIIQ